MSLIAPKIFGVPVHQGELQDAGNFGHCIVPLIIRSEFWMVGTKEVISASLKEMEAEAADSKEAI